MNKFHKSIKKTVEVAVFAAFCFVLTAFARIPYAGGEGYFNLGDVVTLLTAMLLGPVEGAFIGMIGGTMGDLFLGYANFVPFTLAAKGLMAILTGYTFKAIQGTSQRRIIAPLAGVFVQCWIYYYAYAFLYGGSFNFSIFFTPWRMFSLGFTSTAFDALQGFASALIANYLYVALKKIPYFSSPRVS